MVFICTRCKKTLKLVDGMFCPDCGAIGELLDESKLKKKNNLDEKVFD